MGQYEIYEKIKETNQPITTKELAEELGMNNRKVITLMKKVRRLKDIKWYHKKNVHGGHPTPLYYIQ